MPCVCEPLPECPGGDRLCLSVVQVVAVVVTVPPSSSNPVPLLLLLAHFERDLLDGDLREGEAIKNTFD